MYWYSGCFAGVEVCLCFQHPETAGYYRELLKESDPSETAIHIPGEDVNEWMTRWKMTDAAYAEYVISCSCICDFLMQHGRMVFHGAAMLWHDKAYIFSAPSGTGKTTQLRLWRNLFRSEAEVLNGDKPILQVQNNGKILVHPSPWKGKEGYGRDDIIAPLGGIITLRQDHENRVTVLKPAEAAKNLFGRNYSTFRMEQEVRNAGKLMEQIVYSVPVWRLSNKGDEESARMMREELIRQESTPWHIV